MKCPKCSSDTFVMATRDGGEGKIRRRRVCSSCEYRFSTIEEIENKPVRQPKPEKPKREPRAPKVPKRVKNEKVRSMVEEEFDFPAEEREDLSAYIDMPRWTD